MPQGSKPQTNQTATLGSASRPDVHNHDNGVSRETSTTYKGSTTDMQNPIDGMTVRIEHPGNFIYANYQADDRHAVSMFYSLTEDDGNDRDYISLALTMANTGDDPATLMAYLTSPDKRLREEAKKRVRELKKLGRRIYNYGKHIARTTTAV